jgi:hypothetical protein
MSWRRATNWMQHKEPVLGQRYRAAGENRFGQSSAAIWELEKMVHGSDGIEYARLIRTIDHTEHKLVSLTALSDRTFYVPA